MRSTTRQKSYKLNIPEWYLTVISRRTWKGVWDIVETSSDFTRKLRKSWPESTIMLWNIPMAFSFWKSSENSRESLVPIDFFPFFEKVTEHCKKKIRSSPEISEGSLRAIFFSSVEGQRIKKCVRYRIFCLCQPQNCYRVLSELVQT